MTGMTIPDLTTAAALSGSEPVETVQGGVSVKTSVQQIADLANTQLTVAQSASTTYNFILGDEETYILFTSGSSVSAIIPTNATIQFEIGTVITIEQGGAGVVTVSGAGGVTLRSNGSKVATNGLYAVASLVKTASDTWTLFGNLI